MEPQYLAQTLVKAWLEHSEVRAFPIKHDFSTTPWGFNHQAGPSSLPQKSPTLFSLEQEVPLLSSEPH